MIGESTVQVNLDLSLVDIVKLKYATVTADVERNFSQYKSVCRENRRFTFQHLKKCL